MSSRVPLLRAAGKYKKAIPRPDERVLPPGVSGEPEETPRKKEHVGKKDEKASGEYKPKEAAEEREEKEDEDEVEVEVVVVVVEGEEEVEGAQERRRGTTGERTKNGEREEAGNGRTFVKYTSVLKFRLETERDGTRSLWKDKIA